ncbi:SGNH hydrolase domain-containing protein [Ruegeria sp.]|uniref:SGNH hydrolase domain-containing protein n=1 Tax=Ruegeria sp. TaxID=1879320 RepID=UPI003B5CC303
MGQIIVWGDSHASALLPGFDAWLQEQRYSGGGYCQTGLPAFDGCPPRRNGRSR